MPLPVLYRTAARLEIAVAARGYEEWRPGSGSAFLNEIARIEAHIAESPGLYQAVDREVRRAVLRRFPFGLFYAEESTGIIVLACLDLRRDPRAIAATVSRR